MWSTIHNQLINCYSLYKLKKKNPTKLELSVFNIEMHMKEQVNNADRSPQLHKNAHFPGRINAGSELQKV